MTRPDRILIVGGDSMIGGALWAHFAAVGQTVVRTTRRYMQSNSFPRAEDEDRVVNLARDAADWQPPAADVAYLCAAVTSQDHCRMNRAESRAVNVEGTLIVAEKLARQGTHIVFLSTNLVLAGEHPRQPANEPYDPRTVYGHQKAEAEQRLLQLPGTCVVRLTKVLCRGTPLLLRWREELLAGQLVQPFADMWFAPIALDFAIAVLAAVGNARTAGIIQASACEDITYAEVAQHMAEALEVSAALVQPTKRNRLTECIIRHTTLDTSRIERDFNLAPPSPWKAIELGMQP